MKRLEIKAMILCTDAEFSLHISVARNHINHAKSRGESHCYQTPWISLFGKVSFPHFPKEVGGKTQNLTLPAWCQTRQCIPGHSDYRNGHRWDLSRSKAVLSEMTFLTGADKAEFFSSLVIRMLRRLEVSSPHPGKRQYGKSKCSWAIKDETQRASPAPASGCPCANSASHISQSITVSLELLPARWLSFLIKIFLINTRHSEGTIGS